MRADHSKVCVSRCPFCRYYTPYDRASLALLVCPIPYYSTSRVKNIPLPPLTAQVLPSPQSDRNWAPDSLDIISITSSSDTRPLGTVRASVRHRQHRSRHTSLYRPSPHRSDYAPFEQPPCIRDRQALGVHLSPAVLASTPSRVNLTTCHTCASMSIHTSSPSSSPPPSPPDVNSLTGLPLTSLPAPFRPALGSYHGAAASTRKRQIKP